MEELNEALEMAINTLKERIKKNPDFDIYQSINEQLTEIKNFIDNGIIPSEEEKKNIYIGLIAVREFDESDPVLSKALKETQYYYRRL